MDENNLLNDDFTPDNNDPYNETDSKKKKNTIMYVGAGIALVLLLFLIFGTGKKEKKDKEKVILYKYKEIKDDNGKVKGYDYTKITHFRECYIKNRWYRFR